MRFAVVGHVEWVDFLEVSHVPLAGEIVNATEAWAEAAGGGAVAAVQLAKLAGNVTFFTALGSDELGRRAEAQLGEHGVEVAAARREGAQRRAVTFLDERGERTITTIGPRLVPLAGDDLPWSFLDAVDGVYFTGGDSGALRHARRARVLVATPRANDALVGSGVELDALVRSAADKGEQGDPQRLGYAARLIVNTEGPRAGLSWAAKGRPARSGQPRCRGRSPTPTEPAIRSPRVSRSGSGQGWASKPPCKSPRAAARATWRVGAHTAVNLAGKTSTSLPRAKGLSH
jgi:ribokinase